MTKSLISAICSLTFFFCFTRNLALAQTDPVETPKTIEKASEVAKPQSSRPRNIGFRFCGSFTYSSVNGSNAKLLEFHKGDFSAGVPMPSLVWGKGLAMPEEGKLRRGSIWEVRLPAVNISHTGNSNGFPTTSSNRWGLDTYESYKQLIPLSRSKWQAFVGLSLSSTYSKRVNKSQNTYTNPDNTTSIGDEVTTYSNFGAGLYPLAGLLFQPSKRILIDITFSQLLGQSLLTYSWSQNKEEGRSPYSYNIEERVIKTTTNSFNMASFSQLHVLQQAQFGIIILL